MDFQSQQRKLLQEFDFTKPGDSNEDRHKKAKDQKAREGCKDVHEAKHGQYQTDS
jgi:hypothetical protein